MKNKVRTVIRMKYALEMERLGHKVLGTMPNNKDPDKLVWLFLEDDTFDEDLTNLIRGDQYEEKV